MSTKKAQPAPQKKSPSPAPQKKEGSKHSERGSHVVPDRVTTKPPKSDK